MNRDDRPGSDSADVGAPVALAGGPSVAVDERTDEHSTSLEDVKQLGLFAAIASLSYVFWIVGAMEMVERLAYYGVRAVAALYATASKEQGGLGVTAASVAPLFLAWSLVQTIFPIFTGVLSDRYGYKESIAASTVLKILGYLIMAWFPTYWGFYCGAVVLALGTAIFKPGIQGTLVKATTRRNSSMAWGIFYQTVNIGGWAGPLLAAFLRNHFGWQQVFYVCAGIISLNFLLLLTYREVGKAQRLERARRERDSGAVRPSIWAESLAEIRRPHVAVYLLIFSGFWFMFMTLFDVLPLHIRDWVDTTDVTRVLFGRTDSPNPVLMFLVGAKHENGVITINPEGMLNLNAGMIMMTCFLFAALSARFRATTSMVIGALLSSAAMFLCGYATLGWVSLAGIAIFSVGEMLASPKFSEYIGNFAPHDKKAMYLGFSQVPIAIGWSAESWLGPRLYSAYAEKDTLVRRYLLEQFEAGAVTPPAPETFEAWSRVEGVAQTARQLAEQFAQSPREFVEAIPVGEAFNWATTIAAHSPKVLAALSTDAANAAAALTAHLHDTYQVGNLWYVMVFVGLLSAALIAWYGRWVRTLRSVH